MRAEKYYFEAINKGSERAINRILYSYYVNKTLYRLYKILINILDKNDIVKQKIKELEDFDEIKDYFKKVKESEINNNKKRCYLCLEDNILHIKQDCGHEVCIECYEPKVKCYFNFCESHQIDE